MFAREREVKREIPEVGMLEARLRECEKIMADVNSWSDTDRVLERTKGLAKEIQQLSRGALKAVAVEWERVVKAARQAVNDRFSELESELKRQDAKLMEAVGLQATRREEIDLFGLGKLCDANRMALDTVMRSLSCFYFLAAYRTILALEDARLVTKEEN